MRPAFSLQTPVMASDTTLGLQLKLEAKTFSFCKRTSGPRTASEKWSCFTSASGNGPQMIQREGKSKIENLSSSYYKEMVSEVLPTPGWRSRPNMGAGLPSSLHPPLIPTKTVQKVVKGGPPYSSISQRAVGHAAVPSSWETLQVPHTLR